MIDFKCFFIILLLVIKIFGASVDEPPIVLQVESPTAELFRVRLFGPIFAIEQRFSGAYLRFRRYNQGAILENYHPNDKCFFAVYVDPHDDDDDENNDDEAKAVKHRGDPNNIAVITNWWVLAVLPGLGQQIHGTTVQDWLHMTHFNDQDPQAFERWIDARSPVDDYCVVVISAKGNDPEIKMQGVDAIKKLLPRPSSSSVKEY